MTARALSHPVATLCLMFALAASAILCGCSAASMTDNLPADFGVPAGAPARPAVTPQYPAVHDMPPPRPADLLSEDDQEKLERDLIRARDTQEGRPREVKKNSNIAPANPPAATATQPAGSGRNP